MRIFRDVNIAEVVNNQVKLHVYNESSDFLQYKLVE